MESRNLDPINGPSILEVEALCKEQGYGFVMQVASAAWKRIDSVGAIVTGPCVIYTEPCSCVKKGKSPGNCNKCYGCAWQFKKPKKGRKK